VSDSGGCCARLGTFQEVRAPRSDRARERGEAIDQGSLRYVSQVNQERSRLKECRESFALLQRQSRALKVDIGLIQDALEHLEGLLATDIDPAREFPAGMITSILVRPVPATKEHSRGIHCPLCGLPIKRLTPQHAAKHGLSIEEMGTAPPEFGVTQPVEARIKLNMKDFLPKEEVVYSLVAGAHNLGICGHATFTITLSRRS